MEDDFSPKPFKTDEYALEKPVKTENMDVKTAEQYLKDHVEISKRLDNDFSSSTNDLKDMTKTLKNIWTNSRGNYTKHRREIITRLAKEKGFLPAEMAKFEEELPNVKETDYSHIPLGQSFIKTYVFYKYLMQTLHEDNMLGKYSEQAKHVVKAADQEMQVCDAIMTSKGTVSANVKAVRNRLTALGHGLTADFADSSTEMPAPEDADC